jgi:L-rhamnose isomerase/sugar isomerase
LTDAFATDVRPLLAEVRADLGVDPDPIAAYKRSGHFDKIRAERADGAAAGWGA